MSNKSNPVVSSEGSSGPKFLTLRRYVLRTSFPGTCPHGFKARTSHAEMFLGPYPPDTATVLKPTLTIIQHLKPQVIVSFPKLLVPEMSFTFTMRYGPSFCALLPNSVRVVGVLAVFTVPKLRSGKVVGTGLSGLRTY